MLDPGHGGRDFGTVGSRGVREKDVNLGVAHALAELLRGAGASVELTRDGDEARTPAGAGKEELASRVALANELHADLFLAIHHNSAAADQDSDEVQTYYALGDSGPSREVAAAIHARLCRNLGLAHERLLPGNFAVLRQARVPAVLGEASFLSNELTEAALARPEGQRLEAESYFLGLVDYFSRGVPRIDELAATGEPSRPVFTARVSGDGAALDEALTVATLDGVPLAARLSKGTLRAQPDAPLSGGAHELRLQIRNVLGQSSVESRLAVRMERAPASVVVTPLLPGIPAKGPLPLVAAVFDAHGLPVADGTEVSWGTTSGTFDAGVTHTRGGRAANLLLSEAAATVTARSGGFEAVVTLQKTDADCWAVRVAPEAPSAPRATTIAGDAHLIAQREGDVLFLSPLPPGLTALRLERPGFAPVDVAATPGFNTVALQPLGASWMRGRTIVLDPESAPADFEVARLLRADLEAAGARVLLTRGVDEKVDEVARVRIAERAQAVLFLTLAHRPDAVVAHYPTSNTGRALAERLAAIVVRRLRAEPRIEPSGHYLLSQPSGTALLARLPTSPSSAARYAEAYALFLALLVSPSDTATLTVTLHGGAGGSVPDALIAVDGVSALTDANGRFTFESLAEGPHTLSVSTAHGEQLVDIPALRPGESRRVDVDVSR